MFHCLWAIASSGSRYSLLFLSVGYEDDLLPDPTFALNEIPSLDQLKYKLACLFSTHAKTCIMRLWKINRTPAEQEGFQDMFPCMIIETPQFTSNRLNFL